MSERVIKIKPREVCRVELSGAELESWVIALAEDPRAASGYQFLLQLVELFSEPADAPSPSERLQNLHTRVREFRDEKFQIELSFKQKRALQSSLGKMIREIRDHLGGAANWPARTRLQFTGAAPDPASQLDIAKSSLKRIKKIRCEYEQISGLAAPDGPDSADEILTIAGVG